jgi:hypothetical protein
MNSETRYWPAVTCVLLMVIVALAAFHHYGTNRRVARLATEIAQDSGLLNEAVGSSLSMGIFVHGRVGEGADGGNADLEIPVHGSEGRGTLFAWVQRDRGPWRICSLSFRSKGGLSIVIVADETSHCARE